MNSLNRSFNLVLLRARSQGFSLLEVLVAVVIFAIGVLGLASLQTMAFETSNTAYFRTQATAFAYEIVDCMRANRQAALAGAYDRAIGAGPISNPPDCAANACTPAQLATADLDALSKSVAFLPAGGLHDLSAQ